MPPGDESDPKPTSQATSKGLLQALCGQRTEQTPIWLMRQAGRYLPEYREIRSRVSDFLELCYTPSLATEVTLQPVRRFELDAAILFSDILVVPHALGQGVHFAEGEGPVLEAIKDEAALAGLDVTQLRSRLAPVYETVERSAAALRGSPTTLIGFAGAPWTVASYMVEGGATRDFAQAKRWAFERPELFERLVDLLVEATASHLIAQANAGAEALQIFESWAGVLAEREFDRWCVQPIRQIVQRVRAAHPRVPIIGFPRAAGLGYLRFVQHTGVQAVGLDPGVPLQWAAAELQPLCTLQGNLDPVCLMVGGQSMDAAAWAILESWGAGARVFNLGHGVLPATPPNHVGRLVDLVHAWRG